MSYASEIDFRNQIGWIDKTGKAVTLGDLFPELIRARSRANALDVWEGLKHQHKHLAAHDPDNENIIIAEILIKERLAADERELKNIIQRKELQNLFRQVSERAGKVRSRHIKSPKHKKKKRSRGRRKSATPRATKKRRRRRKKTSKK
jgi:hypothetical protein